MGKASRIKRRALKSRGRVRRDSGSYGYYGALAAICVVGVALIVVSKTSQSSANDEPRANQDHWHAAIGVNVCGTWLPNPAEFEQRAGNSSLRSGIHTHGDGLMHIHPFSGDEAGDNATVGTFFDFGGWKVGTDFVEVWDGQRHENGQQCGEGDDAEDAIVRWTVDGEEIRGNPGNYKPADGTVIGIYFVSEDQDLEELGEVPSAAQLADPLAAEEGREPVTTTVAGATTTTAAGGTTTVAGETSTTAAATTTAGADATTTAAP